MTPLPHPHATREQNLVATMLLHGNFSNTLDMDRIARFQGMNPSVLKAEFDRQEARRLTNIPPNSIDDIGEGK